MKVCQKKKKGHEGEYGAFNLVISLAYYKNKIKISIMKKLLIILQQIAKQ